MFFVCVYLHRLEFFAIPYVSNSQIVSFTIIYLKASWINVLMTTPWYVRYSTNAYHIIRFNALCDGWMSIQGISSFGKRNTNTCQNAPTTKTPPLFTKTPPLFFWIKVILPKRPHFFIAKTAHLIIFFYSSEDTCIMCDVL